jgi:glycosyltransferase involved in cell wall biosynthesis
MSADRNFSKVSVLIPCYCSSKTLNRAVDSVLSQTFLPNEIILIDDASPFAEGTAQLIREMSQKIASTHPRISVKTIFLQKNLGPGGARNEGWKYVTQPWIAFLDSDDAWHPMKLEIQMRWVNKLPNVSIIGHEVCFGFSERTTPLTSNIYVRKLSLLEMLFSNQLPTRSVLIRANISFRFAEWRFAEDYYLWLLALSSGYKAYKLNVCLAYFYRPEFSLGGQSGNLWDHEKCELLTFATLMSQKKIGIFLFLIAVFFSLLKFLRRKIIRVLNLNIFSKVK